MSRHAGIIAAVLLAMSASARANYVYDAFPHLPLFAAPISVRDPVDGTDRLFVVEREGRVYVFQNDPTATQRSLFLDIADSVTTVTEGGMFDIAFHPQYEVNRHFYVTYLRNNPRRWILSRFTASAANPNTAPRSSELQLINIAKANYYHNGGCIAFGPDGYLYASLGDDGISALQNAQNLELLHGKVIRIDVDNPSGGKQYGIPAGNPFAGSPNGEREEIWAYGFRNPWRFSFDPPTGRLWLGDVGQDSWEEIDIVTKGRNYGWPRMEGNTCYLPEGCDTVGLDLAAPLYVYPHTGSGGSITGGVVYRGSSNPALVGRYIFTDFQSDVITALTWDGVNPPETVGLKTVLNVPSFGVDRHGELLIPSFDGTIYRFFKSPTPVRTPLPPPGTIDAVTPNPFHSSALITLSLAQEAQATLEVFDVAGRRVATLLDRRMPAGSHRVAWSARDPGAERPSGVYFCRLMIDGHVASTRRIVLLK
jgi:glucose/arabinose dehydrogenase